MKKPLWKHVKVEDQIYLFQIFGIVVTVLLFMVLSLSVTLTRSSHSQEEELLKTGRTLATSPIVTEALSLGDNQEYLNNYLDVYIKSIENLDFVAVCNAESQCIYYPNRAFVGRTLSFGGEQQLLSTGVPFITTVDRKAYGLEMVYTPVTGAAGSIIGYVVLSVFHQSPTEDVMHLLYLYIIISFITAFVGIFLSISIRRRTRTILRGRGLEEYRRLTDERTEVLDALDEAIVAINRKGEVIMMNKAFLQMLGCPDQSHFEGKLDEIFPETDLCHILETGTSQFNVSVCIHGKQYLSSRIPVYEHGVLIGAASIFRNVTEVRHLAQELSESHKMVDSLRSFNHEFMNKLHVILGYLEAQETTAAKNFITSCGTSSASISRVTHEIESTGIAAIIIGKMVSASSYGIKLDLLSDSYCKNMTRGLPFDCYVSILGNLLENSIDELKDASIPVKEINIGLFIDENYTVILVTDTGRGIVEEVRTHLFEKGVSTKGEHHGTGLFLVKELVDKYQGSIDVNTEPGEGTSITISFEGAAAKES